MGALPTVGKKYETSADLFQLVLVLYLEGAQVFLTCGFLSVLPIPASSAISINFARSVARSFNSTLDILLLTVLD